MKILMFGSAFNPPHNGHLRLINEAIKKRNPDLVLLVPTGNPAHKKIADCPQHSRLRMAHELAGIADEKCEVLDYELKKKTISYTINTIHHIQKKYPECEIDLLIGGDMLLYFLNWYSYTEIIKSCTIVAAMRENEDIEKISSVIEKIRGFGGNVELLRFEPFVISSREIREKLRQSKDCSHLIPKEVLEIIKVDKLYRPIHLRTISQHVKELMSPKRYHHTLMVCKMAIRLARIKGVELYKVCAAALLHDVAKEFSQEKMLQLMQEDDIIIEWQDIPCSIRHGYAGAAYAKKELFINDEEILWAIRCHSTGKKNMTVLEKIIYLSDMISEDRSYKEVTRLRELAMKDMDAALLASLELSLFWLSRDKKDISPNTVEAIEELKGKVIEEKKE